MRDHPTPYPEINALLAAVERGMRGVLGANLTGLYLHGSLALGDFHPRRSDVDVLALTETPPTPQQASALAAMHGGVTASGMPWADHMECSYIHRSALRRYDPADMDFPALRADGSFGVDGHGPEWAIQRWVLREHGVAIFGPPLRELIDPIPADALRAAAAGTLRGWWAPQLEDPSILFDPEYQAYAVLTMCRGLYTLTRGEIASKPAAARWARSGPAAAWSSLIDQALAFERGMPFDRLDEVLRMIAFVLQTIDAAKAQTL